MGICPECGRDGLPHGLSCSRGPVAQAAAILGPGLTFVLFAGAIWMFIKVADNVAPRSGEMAGLLFITGLILLVLWAVLWRSILSYGIFDVFRESAWRLPAAIAAGLFLLSGLWWVGYEVGQRMTPGQPHQTLDRIAVALTTLPIWGTFLAGIGVAIYLIYFS